MSLPPLPPVPNVLAVLDAIDRLSQRRRVRAATRVEIAAYLGVPADLVGAEKSLTEGPLGEAISDGLVEQDARYEWYWVLTRKGQERLDSAFFQ